MTERLLAYLRQRANRHGLVLASEADLIRDLGASRERINETLRALASAATITLLAPLPFLVAKFPRSWSGSSPRSIENKQQDSSLQPLAHREVPVSSSAAAAATQQRVVGGAGEGEALLDDVLRILGPDADRDEFRGILAGRDPALIHRCLRRVQATKSFRVSRAALFRSLLQKL